LATQILHVQADPESQQPQNDFNPSQALYDEFVVQPLNPYLRILKHERIMRFQFRFKDLFPHRKPLIACIHLQALPGAPLYGGDLKAVYDQAIAEAELFAKAGVDGLIVENFRDVPFFPDRVPSETVAAMAAICREVVNHAGGMPVGVNVLRNDADAAMGIAAAVGAQFIRVNVHHAAALTDQGVVQGQAYATLRKRMALGARVLIFADVAVKHAVPIAHIPLDIETRDLSERSLPDALIVSGTGTGAATRVEDLSIVKANAHLPVIVGSGTTPDTLPALDQYADGYIVGSHLKVDGKAENAVDPRRLGDFARLFMQTIG
jgi:membrane complex biogenesis BtpA family protein